MPARMVVSSGRGPLGVPGAEAMTGAAAAAKEVASNVQARVGICARLRSQRVF